MILHRHVSTTKQVIKVETAPYHMVNFRFYWPGMDGDVEKYIKNCPRCIRRKAQGKTAAKLVVVDSTYPLDLVCMVFLSV